jgi:hypothetical protein
LVGFGAKPRSCFATLNTNRAFQKHCPVNQGWWTNAVWLYRIFRPSFQDVAVILVERGMIVSDETVRRWCLKFGTSFAWVRRAGLTMCRELV